MGVIDFETTLEVRKCEKHGFSTFLKNQYSNGIMLEYRYICFFRNIHSENEPRHD